MHIQLHASSFRFPSYLNCVIPGVRNNTTYTMRAILNLIMENILLWFLYDIAYMMQAISYPGDYNDPTSDYEQRFLKDWNWVNLIHLMNLEKWYPTEFLIDPDFIKNQINFKSPVVGLIFRKYKLKCWCEWSGLISVN